MYNKYNSCLCKSVVMQHLGHAYTKQLFTVYLTFTSNWHLIK